MRPYQIVLADDHLMLRHGIKRIIEESGDMVVVGEASDGLELLDLLKKSTPDMVILDLSMPKLRGLEATTEIKTLYCGSCKICHSGRLHFARPLISPASRFENLAFKFPAPDCP